MSDERFALIDKDLCGQFKMHLRKRAIDIRAPINIDFPVGVPGEGLTIIGMD